MVVTRVTLEFDIQHGLVQRKYTENFEICKAFS